VDPSHAVDASCAIVLTSEPLHTVLVTQPLCPFESGSSVRAPDQNSRRLPRFGQGYLQVHILASIHIACADIPPHPPL
jgi:hypothetical protein